jgi:hypothetical protein
VVYEVRAEAEERINDLNLTIKLHIKIICANQALIHRYRKMKTKLKQLQCQHILQQNNELCVIEYVVIFNN